MNKDTVLLLDDDQNVLNSLRRLFARDFDILMSTSGPEALDLLTRNEVSVIVSDNLMPGMKGAEFLQHAKRISPDSVRIMLTGYGDMQAAVEAINRGGVYKFVTKPWDNDELKATVLNSIDRYRLTRSLRKADEYSLYSIAQTIELQRPLYERPLRESRKICGCAGRSDGARPKIRGGGEAWRLAARRRKDRRPRSYPQLARPSVRRTNGRSETAPGLGGRRDKARTSFGDRLQYRPLSSRARRRDRVSMRPATRPNPSGSAHRQRCRYFRRPHFGKTVQTPDGPAKGSQCSRKGQV